MSDNSTLPVSVGTEVFANNDIGGIKYPRIKSSWGAPGAVNDTSDAAPLPASVSLDTSKVQVGSAAALTPKFANFAVASSGNNAVVAAVTSKKIRVLAFSLSNSGGAAVTARWQSDGAGTPVNISGKKRLPADGSGFVQGFNVIGWFESASGKSLDLNLTGANEVSGELTYVEV